jgi:hypothetical protein
VEDIVSKVAGVTPGRVSAFGIFDATLQTERMTILIELDSDDARPTIIEARQRVSAAFQISNFEIHAVPSGWLVKSTSGKIARGANRLKWSEQRRSTIAAQVDPE